jgi:hypothetical protein
MKQPFKKFIVIHKKVVMKSLSLKYLIATIAITLLATPMKSQDYKQAIKIKGLSPWGASYKILTGFENGYEISYLHFNHAIGVSTLRIFQEPLLPKLSSKWFLCYGFGAHASYHYSYTTYNPFTPFDEPKQYDKNFVTMGADGYVGIEYRFLKHPFIVSADFVPNFEFFGPNYFKVNMNNLCAGLAYVF